MYATAIGEYDMDGRHSKRARDVSVDNDEEYATLLSNKLSLGLREHVAQSSRVGREYESNDDDGVRVEDLAVANAQGDAVGQYVPPKHLSVKEAYSMFVEEKDRPIRDFDTEMVGWITETFSQLGLRGDSARLGKRGGDDDSMSGLDDSESEVSDEDAVARAQKTLLKKSSRTRAKKRHRNDALDEVADINRQIERLNTYGGTADREYLTKRFESYMQHSNVSEEALFMRICPLCAFMDNTQDAVGDREFKLIDRFADEGIGNMDADTHATLLSFMWNRTIYLPMRRRNMKVLPLSARMAYDHITKPHRWNKRAEKLKDIKELGEAHKLLFNTAFRKNALTGELGFDKDRIAMGLKVMETKWKIAGTKDESDPFRTARRVTAASAGTQTNPLQAVRRAVSRGH